MSSTVHSVAEALYRVPWLPARDICSLDAGRVLVDISDRTGRHRVSLSPDQIRTRQYLLISDHPS